MPGTQYAGPTPPNHISGAHSPVVPVIPSISSYGPALVEKITEISNLHNGIALRLGCGDLQALLPPQPTPDDPIPAYLYFITDGLSALLANARLISERI